MKMLIHLLPHSLCLLPDPRASLCGAPCLIRPDQNKSWVSLKTSPLYPTAASCQATVPMPQKSPLDFFWLHEVLWKHNVTHAFSSEGTTKLYL